MILMCVELILNVVNINFVIFFNFFDSQLERAIFSIFVLAIAVEVTIGLVIASSIYRTKKSTCINQLNLLNK